MKKLLQNFLLPFFLLIFLHSKSQQLLYENNDLGNRIFNPGFGTNNHPNIIFDDINFPSSLTNSWDSVVISQVTVAIGRVPGAPATVVNVYASAPDATHDSLESLPSIPPKLIGTLNLPANGSSNFFTIGDNSTPLAAFKIDTGRFLKGYQTLYIGLSFSDSIHNNIGWYLSNGPDTNYNLIYKYDATNNDTVYGFDLSGTYNLPATFYAVVNGTFKKAVILPVVLSNFKVSNQNEGNLLEWQTQSENNSDYFAIERSGDALHYQSIGQVPAVGFSSKMIGYKFTDISPLQGRNFYRLRMVDKDNANTYSNVVNIANTFKKLSNIFPNPVVTSKFTVAFDAVNAGSAVLQIKNVNGKVVYSKTINVLQGNNSQVVNNTKFASGIYYINITNKELNYIGKIQKF